MSKIIKNVSTDVSRRGVLKAIAGGMVLSVPMVTSPSFAELLVDTGHNTDAFTPSVYFSVHKDSTVKVMIHRVEMGQGTRTGLAQIIADELELDWDRVQFLQAEGDEKYGVQNTDGSRSIRNYYWPLRQAAAAGRMMLEQAGAKKLGLDRSLVKAEQGFIVSGNKKVAYGDLVDLAKQEKAPVISDLTLKKRSEFKHIRKEQKILDMQDIIHGRATYAQDIQLENMVYAVIARPPVLGGKLVQYDDSDALKVRGVLKVIRLKDGSFPTGFMPLGGVAVIATNTFAAIKGRKALKITWDHGANADYTSEFYEKDLWAATEKTGRFVRKLGDADKALEEAETVVSGQYYVPHQSHAHLEPPAAVAEWDANGHCIVYASAQTPQAARNTVAAYCGVDKSKVTTHCPLLGAAFGRKSKPDFAAEAAFLARTMQKPLKIVWTREDDMQHGYYHTVSAQKVDVGLDKTGKAISWRHRAAYPSLMALFSNAAQGPSDFELGQSVGDMAFDIPNISAEAGAAKAKTRVGWMRSVNCIHQGFAVGSMVGEIAHQKGQNHLDTWLDLIGDDRILDLKGVGGYKAYGNYGNSDKDHPYDTARLKNVLTKAAEMAGYKGDQPRNGKAIGLAAFRSFNSYVATAIEVDISDDTVKIPRAWMAIDCGIAVNPDRIKAQMEGAVIFAMTYFFHSSITMKNGMTVQENFDTNPLPRIDEAPEVDVFITDSEANPGGVGEPGVTPVAAAIGNAIFVAKGERVRRLPYQV